MVIFYFLVAMYSLSIKTIFSFKYLERLLNSLINITQNYRIRHGTHDLVYALGMVLSHLNRGLKSKFLFNHCHKILLY